MHMGEDMRKPIDNLLKKTFSGTSKRLTDLVPSRQTVDVKNLNMRGSEVASYKYTLIPAASALAIGMAMLAMPVAAQDQAVPENEPGEIVVTVQKRAERLQDVPLAVTAVGADTLASRQINDTNSLVQAVPSLSFQQGANPTNTSFRIRGVGTALFGQGVEPSVSVVVDGVVAVRSAQGFSELADVERVEVLRGPQGTLFGKNA